MSLYLFIFFPPLLYDCILPTFQNFEFNEEWQGGQFLKKQGNFTKATKYSNCTLNGGNFSFLNQMPFFKFYLPKIQLQVDHNMIELNF